ncbi:hypothetical protein Bca52824_073603 [Brassica carinata]|uniref:Leucine-rich repeat-containing N-terminal plant-type domain-containing protein n=1 Tax=Brassica carinata TaxID=52824 RepID=A0A8X7QAA7_BRACI|nr:hypothetical protein Bca52824_073603 [Brassica carinata]
MVDRRSALSLVSSFFFLSLLLFDCVAVAKSRTRFDELLTLLRLRSTLGLKGTDWPIKGDPCRVWRGIQCDGNGSIVGINISGFKRTRIGKQNPRFAVDPLVNLTRLAYFNASGFALPGSVPDWFGVSLTTLRVLDLSSCSVSGVVPVTLGNLTSLVSLNLSRNSLTGSVPSGLGELSSLSELDLSRNTLTGALPPSFGSLLNLTSLDVSSNYLTGPIPPGVGMLSSKLLYLNFSSNSFSSSIPPQLGDLINLVDLDLSINSLSGSVPLEFRKLTNLRNMVIGDNLLSGALPADLFGAMSQLQSLLLRKRFLRLRILDIAKNNFTGMLPNSSSGPNQINADVVDISSNLFYGELTRILTRFSAMYLSAKGLDFDDFDVLLLKGFFYRAKPQDCDYISIKAERVKEGRDRPKPVTASQPPKGAQTFDLSRLGNAFTYDHLLQATGDFNDANLIKRGHSGSLFRGFLDNGTPIVIKKINTRRVKRRVYSGA